MNCLNGFIAFTFLCSVLVACSKQDSPTPEIEWIGEWVNKDNSDDIIIIEKETIKRTDLVQGGFNHRYNYTIHDDSIALKYNGMHYIAVPVTKFHYQLNAEKNQLEIENLHTYFPNYEGNVFVRKDKP